MVFIISKKGLYDMPINLYLQTTCKYRLVVKLSTTIVKKNCLIFFLDYTIKQINQG